MDTAYVEVGLLGPVTLRYRGQPRDLGGAKQRAVLAMLALPAPAPVPGAVLARGLWGDAPPRAAAGTLRAYLSRLRLALGEDVQRCEGGYRLAHPLLAVDAARFEALTAEGSEALRAGSPRRAAAMLESGLALWRGPALAGVAHLPFAAAEAARLEQRRLEAVEDRIEAYLAAGRHCEVLAELSGLVAANPYHERLAGQLMLALYRSGRQADALAALAALRRRLVQGVGIEPGPQVRGLHAAILGQDPALELQERCTQREPRHHARLVPHSPA